jgi:hypothetical protein
MSDEFDVSKEIEKANERLPIELSSMQMARYDGAVYCLDDCSTSLLMTVKEENLSTKMDVNKRTISTITLFTGSIFKRFLWLNFLGPCW